MMAGIAAAPATYNALAPAGASVGAATASPASGMGNPYMGAPGGPHLPAHPNAAPNALALATTPTPTTGPAVDYQAQYAKSMAAARGAIAAQMASQLAEIQAAQQAGTTLVNGMSGQYQGIQSGENANLNALAAGADQGAAATGVKSLGSASGITNEIAGAGNMATAFDKGAVPMLQQGVNVNAADARNALAVAALQANEALDSQQAGFAESQAQTQEQERYNTQQNALAWAQSPSNPESPAYKAALTLKGLNPDGTPTAAAVSAQSVSDQQTMLDKSHVTVFTAAQAVHVRQTPMYQYISSRLGSGQKATDLFNQAELNNPGVKLALEVYAYDHGSDPAAITNLQGRK